MSIKSMLGFCACKGCWKRHVFNIELKVGTKKKKTKLCEEHTKELMGLGEWKSLTMKRG